MDLAGQAGGVIDHACDYATSAANFNWSHGEAGEGILQALESASVTTSPVSL
jgi:hypothetical protein